MARPVNPLDQLTTYTVHYELHASDDVNKLKDVANKDANAASSPTKANDTLLINTRKDAHQTIDSVNITYVSAVVDSAGAAFPVGTVMMKVIEPNGTSFAQKVKDLADSLHVRDYVGGLHFGLKIFFVGRTSDNIEVTVAPDKIFFLTMTQMDAAFDHRGGEYILTFVYSGAIFAVTPLLVNPLAKAAAYSNKDIAITAHTVQEAVRNLEKKLNDNYANVYDKELNDAGAKRIVYKIDIDPEIDGDLSLSNRDSFKPGEPVKLTLSNQLDIGSMLRTIVNSSKQVNELIAKGHPGIFKEFHPNVRIPVYTGSWRIEGDTCVVHYKVNMYKGVADTNTQTDASFFYEFDYYFSGPGKNVDVMQFDVKFPNMLAWLGRNNFSTALNSNGDSRVPAEQPSAWQSIMTPDKTQQRIEGILQEKTKLSCDIGDPAYLPATPTIEQTGYVRHNHDAVPVARLAFETLELFGAAINMMCTFTIRGHLKLFNAVNASPNLDVQPFGITNGLWVKVNIFNNDGSRFFFTGWYRVISIENVFSGGSFTQRLTVIATQPS